MAGNRMAGHSASHVQIPRASDIVSMLDRAAAQSGGGNQACARLLRKKIAAFSVDHADDLRARMGRAAIMDFLEATNSRSIERPDDQTGA